MLLETVLFLLTLVCFYFALRKPPGLPPGIWGLPVIGKFPSSSVRFGDQVKALRPTHGDILTWRVGGRVLVFLCNQKIIRNALSRPECSARPDFATFLVYCQDSLKGILLGNGTKWQIHRRFVLRHLRNLGMGKSRVELDIQEEAAHLVEELKEHTGKDEQLPPSIGVAVFNVIWKMVADTRYEMDDPRAHEFIHILASLNKATQGSVTIFNFFPWLKKVSPGWFQRWLGLQTFQEVSAKVHQIAQGFINQHKNTLDLHQQRDLIDQYLSAMKEEESEGTEFSLEDLLMVVTDLFLAGIETTTSTLHWSILYLAKYPDVQRRVQQELDEVLPRGTIPQYQDKKKMPYFEAVVSEVHRIVSLVPLSVPHLVTEEIELEGYTIPKDAILMPHLECCQKDPNVWEKPDQFYPEHFLDANGKFVNRENLMPFSTGRRVCLGESLARVEVAVVLMTLLQHFTFSPGKGELLSAENDPEELTFNAPKRCRFIITERQ